MATATDTEESFLFLSPCLLAFVAVACLLLACILLLFHFLAVDVGRRPARVVYRAPFFLVAIRGATEHN